MFLSKLVDPRENFQCMEANLNPNETSPLSQEDVLLVVDKTAETKTIEATGGAGAGAGAGAAVVLVLVAADCPATSSTTTSTSTMN